MNKLMTKYAVVMASVAVLSACTSTPDPMRHCETDDRYHKAQETQMMRIPSDLNQPKYKNTTAIPPKKSLGASSLGKCLERPPVGDFEAAAPTAAK